MAWHGVTVHHEKLCRFGKQHLAASILKKVTPNRETPWKLHSKLVSHSKLAPKHNPTLIGVGFGIRFGVLSCCCPLAQDGVFTR
jgi:hypothetical protein